MYVRIGELHNYLNRAVRVDNLLFRQQDSRLMRCLKFTIAAVFLAISVHTANLKDNQGEVEVGGYLPANWDWRNQNAVPTVKDMGHCSAGWAFSVTAMYQSFLMQVGGIEYDLSEEYVIQCSGQGNCTQDPGFRNLRKTTMFVIQHGIPLQKDLPYQQYNISEDRVYIPDACDTPTVKWLDDVKNHGSFSSGYHNFRAVIKQSPSVSGMHASSRFWQYTGGVYSCTRDQQPIDVNHMNHAVLVIGYNSDKNYIIQNSKGENWGDYGYGIIDYQSDCGLTIVNYQLDGYRLAVVLAFIIFGFLCL